MRTFRTLAVAGLAALLLLGSGAGGATSSQVTTDTVGGGASGEALRLSLLGRLVTLGGSSVDAALDSVQGTLALRATGLGTALSPVTRVESVLGGATGGRRCADTPLMSLLTSVSGLSAELQAALPSINIETACGEASTTGGVSGFSARGAGVVAGLEASLSKVVGDAVGQLRGTLNNQVLATPLGQLVESADQAAQDAVQSVNGLLGTVLGPGVVDLPRIDLTRTLDQTLEAVQDNALFRIRLGEAASTTTSDATRFLAEASDAGGTIEILPGFELDGSPLARIVTGRSSAAVDVTRETGKAVGRSVNTLVRVESRLLPVLNLGQATLGSSKPLEELANQLGLKSGEQANGVRYIELSPGQDVTLFGGTPLESVIRVGRPTETQLPSGRLRVEAAAVSVHLFRNLDSLAPGVGTILANEQLESALVPLASAAGVSLGERTTVPGIQLDLARSLAEGGGLRVAAAPTPAPAPEQLPRTGEPSGVTGAGPAAVALLGSAGLLRLAIRRRRRG